MIKIINGKIVSDNRILQTNIYINEGKIVELTDEIRETDETYDAEGKYVSSGFIDTHVHGGGGADFMDADPEAVRTVAKTHLRHGTTSICHTTAASKHSLLIEVIKSYKATLLESGKNGMPHLVGMHLEGPNFSHAQAGAQDPDNIYPPRPEEYREVFELARGLIRKWSFAPELSGSLEFCDALVKEGILPCIGHSDATYDDVVKAYERGARCLTHFYSGMSGIVRVGGYRVPGVIESGYLLDGMQIEVIGDGSHLPPTLLKMICKLKDNSKIMLVTDAMRAATMPEGPSILGAGTPCIIEDGIAKMPDRSGFAGSVATADRLVRTLYKKAEIPLPTVIDMITKNPAKAIGLRNKGSVLAGYDADLVIFDDDVNISKIFVAGKAVDL